MYRQVPVIRRYARPPGHARVVLNALKRLVWRPENRMQKNWPKSF